MNPLEVHLPPECPAYTAGEAYSLIEQWTGEFLADIPEEMRESLRPAVRAWFLAMGDAEKAQAENEMIQTALLWQAAQRPVVVYGGSPWIHGDVNALEAEIRRLELCIRFGGVC